MKSTKWILLAIFLIAFAVRAVGLFRGLEDGGSFHPDVAKQMRAVHNYLHGKYLWYVGSLAYDGYPYGLNHVDEWLIRAAWPVVRAGVALVQPGAEMAPRPTLMQVYYICLALRVLYSLLALALFYWALVRIGIPHVSRLAWLLLAATAPLLSTVTHAASGDVGTDLFAMAALAFIARARGGTARGWEFFAAGVALGMAFACKYHGVLGALAPGLWLLLAPIAWPQRIRLGLFLAVGMLLGFVILTPHVTWDTKRTLEHIWLNFHYIKNYNVPKSFLELPFTERASISLSQNIPVVIRAMGIGTLLLAGLAALFALPRVVRNRNIATAWDFAVIAMPFAVLFLSLIGKPSLQPFHFSFLPLPFLLGAATLWRNTSRAMGALLTLLIGIALVGNFITQRHEWRYWSREELVTTAGRMNKGLVWPGEDRRMVYAVATLAVEGDNLAVFRNRPRFVHVAHGDIWNATANDRLPSTPWSASPHWLFADLPAFPRESRLLAIRPRECVQRLVVQRESSPTLSITLTAGPRESSVTLTVDGRRERTRVMPGETRTFEFPRERATTIRHAQFEGRLYDVRASVRGAPILLRVGATPNIDPPDDRRDFKLARAYFIAGTNAMREGVLTLRPIVALTPGRYALEVDAPPDAPPIALRVDNKVIKHPDHIFVIPLAWNGETWRAEWDHPASHLFATLALDAPVELEGVPLAWRVRPIRSLPDATPGKPPVWRPQYSFGGGRWIIGNLDLPERLARGDRLRVSPYLDADLRGLESLDDYSAFLHLLDEQGRQVFARDIRLHAIASRFSSDPVVQDLGPLDLPPGRYEVRIGVYSLTNQKRVAPDARHQRDRRLFAGHIVID